MFGKSLAAAAAATMIATPCLAAELPDTSDPGARRSGAVAGAYFRVPLDGRGAKAPQAGLRLSMVHDFRAAGASGAPRLDADSFDLRLMGDKKPTFYVAGRPVTGEARKQFGPVGTAVTVAILVAAAVGAYFIIEGIDNASDE